MNHVPMKSNAKLSVRKLLAKRSIPLHFHDIYILNAVEHFINSAHGICNYLSPGNNFKVVLSHGWTLIRIRFEVDSYFTKGGLKKELPLVVKAFKQFLEAFEKHKERINEMVTARFPYVVSYLVEPVYDYTPGNGQVFSSSPMRMPILMETPMLKFVSRNSRFVNYIHGEVTLNLQLLMPDETIERKTFAINTAMTFRTLMEVIKEETDIEVAEFRHTNFQDVEICYNPGNGGFELHLTDIVSESNSSFQLKLLGSVGAHGWEEPLM